MNYLNIKFKTYCSSRSCWDKDEVTIEYGSLAIHDNIVQDPLAYLEKIGYSITGYNANIHKEYKSLKICEIKTIEK